MSAPVVEKQDSKDANLFLHTKTASENQRDNDASVERTSSVDRQQAQFGNAAVASLPDPRPMAWVNRGLGNSAISRIVQRSIAATKTPQEKRKAKPSGQLKPQDGGNHAPTQRRQREKNSESIDLELPNTGQTVASENAAAQDATALGQTAATSDSIGTGATAESVFQQFATASATQIAARIGGTGETLRQQFQRDRDTFVERSPSVRVAIAKDVAGERRAANAGPAAASKLPTAESIVLGAASPATPLSADETTVKPQPGDNQLQTDAGATPVFRADGEATPDRMKPAATAASSTAHLAGAQILSEINGNTANDRMVVAAVDRAETIELPQTTAAPVAQASGEMLEYLYTDVGSDVRAIADSDFAPILEQTLAGPRVQVETAAAERDANRERAYVEAQAEADATSIEAEKQQHSAIADGQSAVEAEKQIGLRDQQALLNKFDTDANQEFQSQRQEIDSVVKTEQDKANQEIATAEEQARKAATDASEEHRKAKEHAESKKEKKKKKNLLGQLVGWIVEIPKRVLNLLAEKTKEIFSAAKTFVRNTLEAAKTAAVGIITKLRDTVVGIIKTFAAGLKGLVNILLAAFPKLRDKVNAAIDTVVEKAIEVVDAIAKKLEDTVVALIDRVQSVVTKIMDLCELVIVTQLQIASALLSGDFLQAAKILFLAACKAVGIPGEEFLSILSDARDAFMDIIKHPARFLKSLIKSIGQGMGKFMSGFRGHFIGGITGWLFGAVAEGGISLPKTFSLKSVFSLLLQVLGFTYDYIRGVAVRVVGERNVAIVEDVMLKVKTLFTDGPGMIWDWIKDKASEIKQKIIDSVSEWLITQLIMKAATKLATMFTPVGAFVQAVLMMYNTIMFFIERIKQIFAWVKSITSSFTRMAKGLVGAAAEWIEKAMANSIPLIIAFLARLVGLGGIGEKVKGVVTKLRAPIDKAIVFVVGKLVGFARKAWGGIKKGAKRVANWWNAKEEFKDATGQNHTLFLKRVDGRTEVMVASTVRKYDELISQIESNYDMTSDKDKKAAFVLAKIAFRLVRRRIQELEDGKGNDKKQQELKELKNLAIRSQKIIIESGHEEDSILEWLHLTLDAAGMFPGLGIFPDAINTGIYLIECDWTNAGFSAAAMVPILGQGATPAKYGVKATKEGLDKLGKTGLEAGIQQAKKTASKAGKEATTALGKSIGSLENQLVTGRGPWRRKTAHADLPASQHANAKSKSKWKGTTNLEEVYVNSETNEFLVRHRIMKGDETIKESFRPYSKFGIDPPYPKKTERTFAPDPQVIRRKGDAEKTLPNGKSKTNRKLPSIVGETKRALSELDSNGQSHIMRISGKKRNENKHAWKKIFTKPTWEKVSGVIVHVMKEGTEGTYLGGPSKIARYKGFTVEVIYRRLDGKLTITDAWVRSTPSKVTGPHN